MRRNSFFGRGLAVAAAIIWAGILNAAYLVNVPQTLHQPDGNVLRCFASGDEYYNWLHDAAGYTIVQDPASGYYVYAASGANGDIRPSTLIVGTVDPAAAGLIRGLRAATTTIERIRDFRLRTQALTDLSPAPKNGSIENIVIFIRFQDEAEFTDPISTYSQMFNNAVAGTSSLSNYYHEVSYNALAIRSSFFPVPGTTVVSYQDAHPRSYYQPYQAITNPGGYSGGDNGSDRTNREHTLLKTAVTAVAGQIPAGLAVDGDGDGYVDNVVFVVDGYPTGWSSLLWPHQWALYTQTATINGKRVWTYDLQLQSAVDVGVLCHEMFHSLGAPDLYHYSSNGISPVGGWDVMEFDRNPPQHMGAFMKWRYGAWIAAIPEITTSGTYTLNPLTSATGNCFKIRSPNSTTEYFVLEYRRRTGAFETALPGDGLLVYRINTARDGLGNASGPPDEVYIYRPGGTLTVNGTVDSAAFSSGAGRTAINDATNPWSFLSNGGPGGLNVFNVGAAGAAISFDVSFAPLPRITLSKTSLAFGAVFGGASTSFQAVVVGNSGGGTLVWTAASNQSWLTAIPGGGTGTVAVSINASGLVPGTYTGTVNVSATGASNSPQTVTVTLNVVAGGGASPFGSFDTPLDGAAVSSSVPVTGWALDDIEVAGVRIYRNPVGSEPTQPNGLVFIGDAVFVEGARPDVETAYPGYPFRYRAGWGYMLLTNSLPNSGNGVFTLSSFAADKEGHQVLLGQKTITVDNLHATKPFGAIDTPAQGGIASGSSFVNFGWALTPTPKSIPFDGSTITLWVDGLPLGHPVYNNYRADVAAQFPGYANSNGAVGYAMIDTTGYANGTHSIAWSVSDSAGATDGIGSRYFNVLNTGSGSPAQDNEMLIFAAAGAVGEISSLSQAGHVLPSREIAGFSADIAGPVYVKLGYDFARPAEPAYPDREGNIRLSISELERISIHLNPVPAGETREGLEIQSRARPIRARYLAYLVVGSELRPPPIGSSFDSERGVFYWQPGPGFLGDFDFVFLDQERSTRKAVQIRIVSK